MNWCTGLCIPFGGVLQRIEGLLFFMVIYLFSLRGEVPAAVCLKNEYDFVSLAEILTPKYHCEIDQILCSCLPRYIQSKTRTSIIHNILCQKSISNQSQPKPKL